MNRLIDKITAIGQLANEAITSCEYSRFHKDDLYNIALVSGMLHAISNIVNTALDHAEFLKNITDKRASGMSTKDIEDEWYRMIKAKMEKRKNEKT